MHTDIDLATKIGVDRSAISQWKSRGAIPSSRVVTTAKQHGLRVEWVLEGKGPMLLIDDLEPTLHFAEPGPSMPYDKTVSQTLSILSFDVTAGAGSAGGAAVSEQPAGTYLLDPREMHDLIDRATALPRAPFAFRVVGESMEPTLRDGDHVIIEPFENGTKNINAGGIYVFRLEDSIEVKQLERMPGNQIRVSARNPNYSSYLIDLADSIDFSILGRVRGWFKRS